MRKRLMNCSIDRLMQLKLKLVSSEGIEAPTRVKPRQISPRNETETERGVIKQRHRDNVHGTLPTHRSYTNERWLWV